jgi:hypothetical protein
MCICQALAGTLQSRPINLATSFHGLQANVKNVDIIASILQVLKETQPDHHDGVPSETPSASPVADAGVQPVPPSTAATAVQSPTATAAVPVSGNADPLPPQQAVVDAVSADACTTPTASSSPLAASAPVEPALPAAAASSAALEAHAVPLSPVLAALPAAAPPAPAPQPAAGPDLMAEARAMAQQVRTGSTG